MALGPVCMTHGVHEQRMWRAMQVASSTVMICRLAGTSGLPDTWAARRAQEGCWPSWIDVSGLAHDGCTAWHSMAQHGYCAFLPLVYPRRGTKPRQVTPRSCLHQDGHVSHWQRAAVSIKEYQKSVRSIQPSSLLYLEHQEARRDSDREQRPHSRRKLKPLK
jgi:hypothetical protein